MYIINYIQIAFKALLHNGVRTILTLLGIVIGIGSVISLMALSGGATNSITGELSSLGTNLVTVSPGASSNAGGPPRPAGGSQSYLENEVLGVIENRVGTDKYDKILPTRSASVSYTYKDKTQTSILLGVSEDYFKYNTVEVSSGRLLTNSEIVKGSNLIILPKETADKLFGTENPIGLDVGVNNKDFEVVGISKAASIGQSQAITSIESVQNTIANADNYSSIVFSSKEGKSEDLKNEVKAVLLKYYDVSEDDANFSVSTSQGLLDSVKTITNTLSILLVAISAISLLVGGIGIMNIMLVTVSERTREIGLRKAVGAKIQDILTQFLTESIIITLIGGIIGIGLGWAVSFISTNFFNFPAPLTFESILLAVGVSSGIGVVFGFYPAWKAARLQPIVALKSE
jgi:putative ABC transport system permease protein